MEYAMTLHDYKSGLMQNMIDQHLKQYDNSHTIYIYNGLRNHNLLRYEK